MIQLVDKLEPFQFLHFGPFISFEMTQKKTVDKIRKMATASKKIENDARDILAGLLDEQYLFSNKHTGKINDLLSPYIDRYINNSANHFGRHQAIERDMQGKKLYLKRAWVNYMKAGEMNPAHSHDGFLSFILYLNVPSEIAIASELIPRRSKRGAITFRWGEDAILTANRFALMPVVGQMFIFPAHVEHQVLPFTPDVTRVSVSGNWFLT